MQSEFLGLIHFGAALARQQEIFTRVRHGDNGVLLGFESEPVITLGIRANSEDLIKPEGFALFNLDRGGQATIHNPGQLVIFPIVSVKMIGARRWIECLRDVTAQTLKGFDKPLQWNPQCPGLYSSTGKVVSIGIRVRRGISTHGLAINVRNRLEDFRAIRPCGVQDAPLDLVGDYPLTDIFNAWVENFHARLAHELTSPRFLPNLLSSDQNVRL